MGFQHQAGDDFSSGTYLRDPGVYHLCVTGMEENPTRRDGSLIDNAAFKIDCEVLAGTVAGQEQKTVDITFFHPKPGDKNNGAFARKKMDRFFIAVGLMAETDKGKNLDINLQDAVGRHFVVKLESSDDGKFLQMAFADVYHVDDPYVKPIPKSEVAMNMPAPWRRIGSGQRAGGTATASSATNGTAKPAFDPATL